MLLGVNTLKTVLVPGYVKLFELLTQFPQNSFLQCLVETSFSSLLKSGFQKSDENKKLAGVSEPFAYTIQIFKEAGLLSKIAVQAESHLEFEFESARKIRNPHMAFCTLIGNLIQSVEGLTDEEISSLADISGLSDLITFIKEDEQWQAYVAGDLSSINTINASSLAPRNDMKDEDSDDEFGNYAQAEEDDGKDEEDDLEEREDLEEEENHAADSLRTFNADEASDDHIT